ncbi:hypothetical protein Sjap_013835 [Stephania japonica]|uniref:Uncharacterized protein n=1 Tax=Stephania japonica TaxID=461633 RepID=A0AAP0J0G6_9MAGN
MRLLIYILAEKRTSLVLDFMKKKFNLVIKKEVQLSLVRSLKKSGYLPRQCGV